METIGIARTSFGLGEYDTGANIDSGVTVLMGNGSCSKRYLTIFPPIPLVVLVSESPSHSVLQLRPEKPRHDACHPDTQSPQSHPSSTSYSRPKTAIPTAPIAIGTAVAAAPELLPELPVALAPVADAVVDPVPVVVVLNVLPYKDE
jgi:hypothetical protein